MNLRELMIEYGMRFIGTPYIWGGESFAGFDCSGFAQECLKSVGLDPIGDQSAAALLAEYRKDVVHAPEEGCLVFFGKGSGVSHVAIYVGHGLMIEAGGGGGECRTVDDARKIGAMVRIRPVSGRKDFLCYADPFIRMQ